MIALLVAMLMPALSQARRSANATMCASQMRQIGAAFNMYSSENHQMLPYALYATVTPDVRISWDDLLNHDLGGHLTEAQMAAHFAPINNPILTCPSDKVNREWAGWSFPLSYAMPYLPVTQPAAGQPAFVGVAGIGNFATPDQLTSPLSIQMSKIHRPAETLLLVEVSGYLRVQGCDYGAIDNPMQEYPHSIKPITSHEGRWNYLFGDGHVSLLHPQDTIGSGTMTQPQGAWTRTGNN